MSVPIIITPPPPPPPPPPVEKAALAFPWWRKWSTWLAITAGGISAACGAALLVYAGLPAGAQATVDAGLLGLLSKLLMGSAAVSALIPLATGIRQKTP